MLDHLTVGDFIGHMNATFRVNMGSGEMIDLELIEAKTIGEGARPGLPGIRELNLTGITAGGGETQTLTVTSSSNNTTLIPNPTITYTSPNSTGTLTFTRAANSFGTATITVTVSDDGGANTTSVHFTVTVDQVAATVSAVSADWGTNGTIALQTAADGLRLLPAGRTTDLPWYGINKLQITLSQAETLLPSDVSVTGIAVAYYGPVTISGSGANYTITFAQAITTADRVTVTIGNAGIATYTRRLDVLPGDFNDDGVVNSQDAIGIRNEWLGVDGATPTIFGDINGDGTVNVADYNAVRLLIGTSLPTVSPPAIVMALANESGPANEDGSVSQGGPASQGVAPSQSGPASQSAPASQSGPASQSAPALVQINTIATSRRTAARRPRPRAEIVLSKRKGSLVSAVRTKMVNQPSAEKLASDHANRRII
jgi:hypothetical protein